MDQSHATLNQTVNDLSISLQTFIVDAKKGREMKGKAEADAAQARVAAEEKVVEELVQALAEEDVAEAVEERVRKKIVAAKKKNAASSLQPAIDLSEYIYLAIFHA